MAYHDKLALKNRRYTAQMNLRSGPIVQHSGVANRRLTACMTVAMTTCMAVAPIVQTTTRTHYVDLMAALWAAA